MRYNDILALKEDIDNGRLNVEKLTAYDNTGELHIYDEDNSLLYDGEYFSHQACDDVCALLGIEELNEV